MIAFKRLDLTWRQEVFDWFHRAGRLGCEYSFVNLYLWGRQHAAFVEGYLVVFAHFYGHSMYLFPSGHGPLKPVLEALRADAREREIPFRLTSMSVADCRAVEELYPGGPKGEKVPAKAESHQPLPGELPRLARRAHDPGLDPRLPGVAGPVVPVPSGGGSPYAVSSGAAGAGPGVPEL